MIQILVGNKKERKSFISEYFNQLDVDTAKIQHIYPDDLKDLDLESLISPHLGLFGEKEYFVLHGLLRSLDLKSIFPVYQDSEHVLFFSEESILKAAKTQAEKEAIPVVEFEKEQKEKKSGFNIFSLADALGNRDKKQLWLLFHDAIKSASPEEIHGVLFWQMKNLSLVKTSVVNPGMNGFVYTKNKNFVKNFSKMDLVKLNALLVKMFHERDAYSSLDIELEKFILAL